eukprot:jgi/Botrbrau1/20893/Bobra.0135s0024.1
MGKVSARKKVQNDSSTEPATSSRVMETVMVKADDVEDVPGWKFRPDEALGSPSSRPVRVYADGIFDLFHFGHARALEQAKKLFPNSWLIVGCCNDELTHKYKGKTVLSDRERYESLRHCKWVDEVIMDAPWVITPEFLEKHKIDYVTHDELPYADVSGSATDVYDFVKKVGKFKATKRTEGVSTSDIILRIIKNYNDYVLRQLSRGYTRKELGLSFVWEQQIRMRHNMQQFGEQFLKRRLRVRDRVRKRTDRTQPVRIIPREMEQGLKGFAAGVEQTVDKLMSGELSSGMTHYMDGLLSGFIRGFEANYSKFEEAVRQRFGLQAPSKGRDSKERVTRMALWSPEASPWAYNFQSRPITRRQTNARQHLWNWQVFGQANSEASE